MAIPGFEPTTGFHDEATVIEPFWYPGLAADLAAMAEISAHGFITGDWSVEYPPIAEPLEAQLARAISQAFSTFMLPALTGAAGGSASGTSKVSFPAAAMRDSAFR